MIPFIRSTELATFLESHDTMRHLGYLLATAAGNMIAGVDFTDAFQIEKRTLAAFREQCPGVESSFIHTRSLREASNGIAIPTSQPDNLAELNVLDLDGPVLGERESMLLVATRNVGIKPEIRDAVSRLAGRSKTVVVSKRPDWNTGKVQRQLAETGVDHVYFGVPRYSKKFMAGDGAAMVDEIATLNHPQQLRKALLRIFFDTGNLPTMVLGSDLYTEGVGLMPALAQKLLEKNPQLTAQDLSVQFIGIHPRISEN
jgi:hypothetical protein